MATSAPTADAAGVAALQHWSTYGQRGRRPDHRVMPWEWKHKAFLQPWTSPWILRIESTQLTSLILGFVPKTDLAPIEHMAVGDIVTTHIFMSTSRNPNVTPTEDKWFIYADGPINGGEVRIHMHRSWTGTKQIELVIDAGLDGMGRDGKGPSIRSISWEADPQNGLGNPSLDTAKAVAREVCSWVLNVDLPADSQLAGMEDALSQYLATGIEGSDDGLAALDTSTLAGSAEGVPSVHLASQQSPPRPQNYSLDGAMNRLSLSRDGTSSNRPATTSYSGRQSVSDNPGVAQQPLDRPEQKVRRGEVREASLGTRAASTTAAAHQQQLIDGLSSIPPHPGGTTTKRRIYASEHDISRIRELDQKALIVAVHANQIETVQQLLNKGADVNFSSSTQETPLLVAVKHNYTEMIDILLGVTNQNIDVNKSDRIGWTALAYAANAGNTKIVTSLMKGRKVLEEELESPRSPVYWMTKQEKEQFKTVASSQTSQRPVDSIIHLVDPRVSDPGSTAQFGSVNMLALPLEINNRFVTAIVSTGSQVCVCGRHIAQYLDLEKLIDKRFAGRVISQMDEGTRGGVIGRIHRVGVRLAGQTVHTSVSVLETGMVDFIVGLQFFQALGGRFDFGKCSFVTENPSFPQEARSIPLYDYL